MTDWKALIGMIEMIEKVDKEGEDHKEDSYNGIDKLALVVMMMKWRMKRKVNL